MAKSNVKEPNLTLKLKNNFHGAYNSTAFFKSKSANNTNKVNTI